MIIKVAEIRYDLADGSSIFSNGAVDMLDAESLILFNEFSTRLRSKIDAKKFQAFMERISYAISVIDDEGGFVLVRPIEAQCRKLFDTKCISIWELTIDEHIEQELVPSSKNVPRSGVRPKESLSLQQAIMW